MYREAGLKPSFKVGLSLFRPHEHNLAMYQPGAVSRIDTAISILPYFTDPISFCWRSKTGRLVLTYTEEFDEADLECWIEGMKPKLYWEQLNQTKADHPFKIKNLPYELEVYGFGTHMGLTIELKDVANASTIITQLSNEVNKYNLKSEAKERAYGVVHNGYGEFQNNEVVFRLDVGSAGVAFIKKPLRLLAKFPEVKKVTIDL